MSSSDPISRMSVILGAEIDQYEKNLLSAERSLKRLQYKMNKIGRTLARSVSAPLAAIGVASVKSFADFDGALTRSTSIMGDVSDSMKKKLADSAINVSNTVGIAADKTAEAYYFLASAGLSAEASIASLPQVAKFAKAGMFDLATATDLATDAQSALGLSVKDPERNLKNLTRVTDVLVKGNTLANASVQQFSESLTNKAGAALRIVGKDIEEGVAVLAAFADQGVKGAEAGTALNVVFRDLQTSALKNKKRFSDLGISVFDSSGEMVKISSIISDLETRLTGMSDAQKKATLTSLGFQDKSVSFIQTLLGTSGSISRYEAELRKAGGTTDEVANKQMQSFGERINIVWNRLKNLGITIGQILVPLVEELVDVVSVLVKKFENLAPSTQKNIVIFGTLAAAVAPLILALSKLIPILVLLSKTIRVALLFPLAGAVKMFGAIGRASALAFRALKAGKGVFAALSIVMTPIAVKVALITAALAALGVAAYYVYDNYETFKERFLALWVTIKNKMLDVAAQIVKATSNLIDPFGIFKDEAVSAVDYLEGLKEPIPDVERKFKSFGETMSQIGDGITASYERAKAAITGMFSAAPGSDPEKEPETSPTSTYGGRVGERGKKVTAPQLDLTTKGIETTEKKLSRLSEQLANEIAPTISLALGDIAGSFLEMSAAAAVSGSSFGSVMNSVLMSLADLAIRVGKIAIGVAIAIDGIKKALKSLQPGVALAAGIALIGLGSAAKVALSNAAKNSGSGSSPNVPQLANGGIAYGRTMVEVGEYSGVRSNPEVIAPFNKLKKMLGSEGGGSARFVIERDVLVAFLEKGSKNRNRLTGKSYAF